VDGTGEKRPGRGGGGKIADRISRWKYPALEREWRDGGRAGGGGGSIKHLSLEHDPKRGADSEKKVRRYVCGWVG